MKKLFVVMVIDVDNFEFSTLYYIKADNALVAEEKARELVIEDFGYDEEELDEMVNFDTREFDISDVVEA